MSQSDLFGADGPTGLEPAGSDAPLAARMRPRSFDEFAGQRHLVAPDAAFRKIVEADQAGSFILWGPPGVGKTTLAEIVARTSKARFVRMSATSAGVADLRKVVEEARRFKALRGERTMLFIDEIHRFNKSQQDAILPHAEDGTVTLVGATTENPSFEVNAALLSRCRVYTLKALEDHDIANVISRALADSDRGLAGRCGPLSPEAADLLVNWANGDARAALGILELCAAAAGPGVEITKEHVEGAAQRRALLYDKEGEQHFDLISALHKSVRGSDPDATLYWLARMLESGEDPLYLARRLIRMATEDIGLAEPQALAMAMATQQAVHFLGMPEGELALAQCAVFLACAPKSNRVYEAYRRAKEAVHETRNDPVPLHLRNAPTGLMKKLGYGKEYRYAHDYDEGVVEQQNLPDSLQGSRYYEPTDRGYEARIGERLAKWRRILVDRDAEPGK
ncbi:MAG: replication-associated recombination protein A [Fimbriimonadaceae bacterium]|nr:replication-associated recombination protein A [Fimbriimonadaceae bacterium]